MDCPLIREKLTEYQLGILGDEEARAIAAHLETCADCRAELAALERLDNLLAPVEQVKAPADMWSHIQPRLQSRRVPWWQAIRVSPRPAIAASAAMLLAALGVWMAVRQPGPVAEYEALGSTYQEQQIVAEWSSPLADDAALGVMFASLNGDVVEQ